MSYQLQSEEKAPAPSFHAQLQRRLITTNVGAALRAALQRLWARIRSRSIRHEHGLRLLEMVGLGEKRFVAVVEYQNEKFLLGGAPGSVSLLSSLRSVPDDGTKETCVQKSVKRATRSKAKKASFSKSETQNIVALLAPTPRELQATTPKRKRPSSARVAPSVERFA